MNEFKAHAGLALLAFVIGSVISFFAITITDSYREINILAEKTKPVVADMTVVNSYEFGPYLHIKVVGRKVRDCGPPLQIYGRYGHEEQFNLNKVLFMDDMVDDGRFIAPDDNFTGNKKDLIDFGWWRIEPSPKPFDLHIYVTHNCDGFIVESKIGKYQYDPDTDLYR